jgi:hypothetical protein
MVTEASAPTSDTGRMPKRRNSARWIVAGTAFVLVTVAISAGGVILGRHLAPSTASSPQSSVSAAQAPAPSPPSGTAPSNLEADFAQLQTQLHAPVGIAVTAVGSNQPPMKLGDQQSGPAWSTIKVPLAIAALRQENPPTTVTSAMSAAITESDNTAAESIWAGLGDPVTAAHEVEAVLQETGDPTTVEYRKVRPEFTAFGQTDWSLEDQVKFLRSAVCDPRNDPIFALMGEVVPDQRWGIGTIPDSRFKGGWGPSPTGNYLVRQIGTLNTPTGTVAVAIAVAPASGSFDEGTSDLTEVANWLHDHLAAFPAGHCSSPG